MFRTSALGLVGFLALAGSVQAQQAAPAAKDAKEIPSQEVLEQQFAETMTGATLVGRFTVNGENSDQPLKEDRYTLGTVKKLPNGFWSFETRIQYGERDLKMQLAIQVKWAGDTPVITLTDVGVPGMGTFTARVLVFRGEYAGTWSAGDHGGLMFGRIEKASTEAK